MTTRVPGDGLGDNWSLHPGNNTNFLSATWGGTLVPHLNNSFDGWPVWMYKGEFSGTANWHTAEISNEIHHLGIAESDFPTGGTGTFSFNFGGAGQAFSPQCAGDAMVATILEFDNIERIEYATGPGSAGTWAQTFGDGAAPVNEVSATEAVNSVSNNPSQPMNSLAEDNILFTTAAASTDCGDFTLTNNGGTDLGGTPVTTSVANANGTYQANHQFNSDYSEDDGLRMSIVAGNDITGSISPHLTHNNTACGPDDPMDPALNKAGLLQLLTFRLVALEDSELPVELISFEAVGNGEQVDLSWTTAGELNNQSFLVERSRNRVDWRAIASVQGAGTTAAEQHYRVTDTSPNSGANYYRLKQLDLDGRFTYSSVVVVNMDDLEVPVTLFPNPARDILNVESGSDFSGVTLFTLDGRKVRTSDTRELPLDGLSSGLYLVSIQTTSGRVTSRLIVKE